MEFCHQKHKHCFVACCASLLGKNDLASQEKIVADYPHDLRYGQDDEGVPATVVEAGNVVKGLGLSTDPQLIASTQKSFAPISEFLRQNKHLAERVFIFTRHPTNHCMAVKDILDNKIVVMDPSQQDFGEMLYAELETREPFLYLL